jgi:hypothetical protein
MKIFSKYQQITIPIYRDIEYYVNESFYRWCESMQKLHRQDEAQDSIKANAKNQTGA